MEFWPPVLRAYGSERLMVKFVLRIKLKIYNLFFKRQPPSIP
jgi:hypothetical protein